jgi:hypothetical protein
VHHRINSLNYFDLVESPLGIIVGKIWEKSGLMPSEIIGRRKDLDPDMMFIYRYMYIKLKAEGEERQKQQDKIDEIEKNQP